MPSCSSAAGPIDLRLRFLSLALAGILLLLTLLLLPRGTVAEGTAMDCRNVGHFGGSYDAIDQEGDYLYEAHGSVFRIYDVSDPEDPQAMGSVRTPAMDLAVEGDHVYLVHTNLLVIIDASDRNDPRILSEIETGTMSYDVAASGNFVFVTDLNEGIVVVDARNKAEPSLIGSYATDSLAMDIDVDSSGNYLFIANSDDGLLILDVSNKAKPKLAGQYYHDEYSANELEVHGDYAYLVSRYYAKGEMSIIDVSDREDPQRVSGYQTNWQARSVTASGDLAYLSTGSDLRIVDVSTKNDPQFESQIETGGALKSVVLEDHVFVADHGYGLTVVDVSQSDDPEIIWRYGSIEKAEAVAVLGDLAFLVGGESTLIVLDIEDKDNPRFLGEYRGTGYAMDIFLQGDFAFIATGDLTIVDISNKADPKLVTVFGTDGSTRGVHVSRDHAYLASSEEGLVVVDISDPENPVLEGQLDTDGRAMDVVVEDGYAYIADDDNGFVIMDVSDPGNPEEVAQRNTQDWAYDVAVKGDRVFVTDFRKGFVVFDVSDRADPVKLTGASAGNIEGIAVQGEHVFLAASFTGLRAYHYDGQEELDWAGSCVSGGYSTELAVLDNHAYLADETNGLAIIELAPLAVIDSVSPNPALAEHEISFSGLAHDNGRVERFVWSSSLDGILCDGEERNFSSQDLSVGVHDIRFKVQDEHGAWSRETNLTLVVTQRPEAFLDPVDSRHLRSGDIVLLRDVTLELSGYGTDDGEIIRYSWTSSLEGEVVNDTTGRVSTLNLSMEGTHQLSFRAQDDLGFWSKDLVINITRVYRPGPYIASPGPSPILMGRDINFTAQETYQREIQRYLWSSDIHGVIYNGTSPWVTVSNLSAGVHTLTLRTECIFGFWSRTVTSTLRIHTRPVASILSIQPEEVDKSSIRFTGLGEDDASVFRYVWRSSLDGVIYNGTKAQFTSTKLTPGNHTIYLRVQDTIWVWSEEVSFELEVKESGDDVPGDEPVPEDEDDGSFLSGFEFLFLIICFAVASLRWKKA